VAVKKKKKKEFHFTLKHFFRILIFLIIVYSLISFFHQHSKPAFIDPTLSEIEDQASEHNLADFLNKKFKALPTSTQQKVLGISQTPQFQKIQTFFDTIKKEIPDFPQKQIKAFKKSIIDSIYQDMVKGLED